MNHLARRASSILQRPSWASCGGGGGGGGGGHLNHQQSRGIRVKVLNGNLEQALGFMQRTMQSSGIERLIKREQTHHLKNSEKRVLARKLLERKIRSQDLARKLKAILIKKVR